MLDKTLRKRIFWLRFTTQSVFIKISRGPILLTISKMVWLKWILTRNLFALQWTVMELEFVLSIGACKVVKVVEVYFLIPNNWSIESTISITQPFTNRSSSVMIDSLVEVGIRSIDMSCVVKIIKIFWTSISTMRLPSISWSVSTWWSSSIHIFILTVMFYIVQYLVNVARNIVITHPLLISSIIF